MQLFLSFIIRKCFEKINHVRRSLFPYHFSRDEWYEIAIGVQRDRVHRDASAMQRRNEKRLVEWNVSEGVGGETLLLRSQEATMRRLRAWMRLYRADGCNESRAHCALHRSSPYCVNRRARFLVVLADIRLKYISQQYRVRPRELTMAQLELPRERWGWQKAEARFLVALLPVERDTRTRKCSRLPADRWAFLRERVWKPRRGYAI